MDEFEEERDFLLEVDEFEEDLDCLESLLEWLPFSGDRRSFKLPLDVFLCRRLSSILGENADIYFIENKKKDFGIIC